MLLFTTTVIIIAPNGLVVELSGMFNDVQMPVCGYYSNWAHMFGHHHYLYAFDQANGNEKNEDMNPEDVAEQVSKFYHTIHSSSSDIKK